jgi:chromosome segregation ATPase
MSLPITIQIDPKAPPGQILVQQDGKEIARFVNVGGNQGRGEGILDRLDHLSQFGSVTAKACKDAAKEIRLLESELHEANVDRMEAQAETKRVTERDAALVNTVDTLDAERLFLGSKVADLEAEMERWKSVAWRGCKQMTAAGLEEFLKTAVSTSELIRLRCQLENEWKAVSHIRRMEESPLIEKIRVMEEEVDRLRKALAPYAGNPSYAQMLEETGQMIAQRDAKIEELEDRLRRARGND